MCKGAPEPEALKAGQLWRARGRFYDLRAFAAKHPGGARVIQDCVGDDVEVLVLSHPELKGSVGEGPNQTNYSDRSSVRILSKFRNFDFR